MAIKVGETIPKVKLKTVHPGWIVGDVGRKILQGKKGGARRRAGAFTWSARTITCRCHRLSTPEPRGADVVCRHGGERHRGAPRWFQAEGRWATRFVPLADGNGDFARALGLESTPAPSAWESARSATPPIVDDGRTQALSIDQPGEVARSSASSDPAAL